jgi:hypothetical protein
MSAVRATIRNEFQGLLAWWVRELRDMLDAALRRILPGLRPLQLTLGPDGAVLSERGAAPEHALARIARDTQGALLAPDRALPATLHGRAVVIALSPHDVLRQRIEMPAALERPRPASRARVPAPARAGRFRLRRRRAPA